MTRAGPRIPPKSRTWTAEAQAHEPSAAALPEHYQGAGLEAEKPGCKPALQHGMPTLQMVSLIYIAPQAGPNQIFQNS